jgi:DNA-3-methyladenine glycosylase II
MRADSASPTGISPPLTTARLRSAASELTERDPDLRRVVRRLGPPPLWDRPPGFATLVRIILEQQVSLASARAAFARLADALATVAPAPFLSLDDAALKTIGFSRQKTRSCRALAQAVLVGTLDLDGFDALPDDRVRDHLTAIPGIGPWTADIYLLMALCRPDVWPVGDLALRTAAQDLKKLPAPPTAAEFRTLGEAWRPWRSVAARLLWHHYLNQG